MTINQDILLDYVMGALTPEEVREVVTHLNKNSEDAAHVRDLFETMTGLAFEQEPDVVPEGAVDSLLARIRPEAANEAASVAGELETGPAKSNEVEDNEDSAESSATPDVPDIKAKLSLDELQPSIQVSKSAPTRRANQYQLDEDFFENTSSIPRANIADRGSTKPKPIIQDRPAAPRWVAGFAAAAALALFAYLGFQIQSDPVTSQLTKLCNQEEVSCEVMTTDAGDALGMLAREENNELFVVFNEDPPEGQVYQAWEIAGDDIVSLGVWDERVIDLEMSLAEESVFGVTIEPEGGSEQPTSTPIIVIPVSS